MVVENGMRGETPAPPTAGGGEIYVFPASFAQQRLWFLDQMEPGSPAYNLYNAVRLVGDLRVDVLARTLEEIVARHETLRTTFATMQDEPVQVISPAVELRLPLVDLASLPVARRDAELAALSGAEGQRPFDLAAGPLMRVTLVRLAGTEHAVLFNLHHIVGDGWSMGVLVRELALLYTAFAQGEPSPLPDLPLQYADFAQSQRDWLQGKVLTGQIAYWRQQLAGLVPLDLPADHPRPAVRSPRGGITGLLVPAGTAGPLAGLARQRGTTLFVALLAAVQALLHRYSGSDDTSVGTVSAGRNHLDTEGMIGFFVNTLVMRTDLSGGPSFGELLSRAQATALGAFSHQDLPFERLVEELQPERDLSRSPFFDVLLVLQNTPPRTFELPGLVLLPAPAGAGNALYDWTFNAVETDGALILSLSYSAGLFEAPTAGRVLSHLRSLMDGAGAAPDRPLAELCLLSPPEQAQASREWNDTAVPRSGGVSLHGLVADQAARAPDSVAVTFEGTSLTYGELRLQAGRLARRLRACGPEVLVGIALERSLELVVALLGALEAGAAYLPLDPDQPRERLALMIEDAAPAVVVTQEHLLARLPELAVPAVLLAGPEGHEDPLRDPLPARRLVDDRQLAYVIFTSGSTGRPKASMLHHRGIVNRLLWMVEAYGLSPADVVLQKTPIGFDVSVWELFAPLVTGGRMVLARPDGHREPAYLAGLVAREGVTVLHFVASLLRAYLDETDLAACPSPRLLVASGEALTADLVERSASRFPAAALENLYGPTEASVEVSAWSCGGPAGDTGGPVPIGRPVANVRLHVIAREGQPAAIGLAGELWIAGVAVGRGYLGRPGLTAERFVPDPFPVAPGDRAYRTGDLARWRRDGAIEYLGRLDQQVKIRGFRVEPEEIEAALASHPAVRQAVVSAIQATNGLGGVPRLVAWVVTDGRFEPDLLRRHLRARLPEPMVPGLFVPLEALPLTASGKIDRRALPLPEIAEQGHAASVPVAPRNGFEEILAHIWAAVLGLEQVGVQDDFFALGGHSLLAVQVVSRVRAAFGVELPVRALFDVRTVAGLAAAVEVAVRGGAVPAPPLVPAPRGEDGPPLSFAQQRLWFLHQLDPSSVAYNLPVGVRLSGHLDRPALERAMQEIVRRHEALRTTFRQAAGEAVQVIAPAPERVMPLVDLSALGGEAEGEALRLAGADAARPFDLTLGPLFRPVLLRIAAGAHGDHVVSATMHHIVSDGLSLEVFTREVTALYFAFHAGEPSPLPELPVQYADYALWQRRWLAGEVMERELAFWHDELQGMPPFLELPADRPRPAVQSFRGGFLSREPGAAPAARLRGLARKLGATPFMVALAAYQACLGRLAGVGDFAVGVPVSGRTRQEVEGLIGCFVNTLVIRADLRGDPSFHDLVLRVRERSLAAQAHQTVPFEKLVEELQPERSLDRSPLVQVTLTHQPPVHDLAGASPAVRAVPLERGTVQFDLSVFFREVGGGLLVGWRYSSDLFDAVTAERHAAGFERLLAAAVESPGARLSALSLLAPAEHHQLVVEWNDTASSYPAGEGLAALFARQVRHDAEAPAVCYGDVALTYGELDREANRLAHHLRAFGVGRGTLVGLSVERSARAVVATLAVIKAGGAYVPLDPAQPAERLAFLLEDSGAAVVLADDDFPLWLPGVWVISLDGEAAAIAARPDAPPDPEADGSDLAYVIYTSGSTGRPKGVAVPQAAIARLVLNTDYVRLGPGRRVAQAATLAFDAATFEIWGPLLTGGTVVGLPREVTLSPAAFAAALRELAIDTLFLTTALYNRVAGEEPDAFALVRDLLVGGEALDPGLMRDVLRSASPPARLSNIYGPTESTTFAVRGLIREVPPGVAAIPLGLPIANTRGYVLDSLGQPAPLGTPGELLLGGDGLAWGYHRRPELTAERFVPDPFAIPETVPGTVKAPGSRLYRTGDLVRRRPDGRLDFVGRIDHQVKLRGFRIEPGEIEAVLAGHSGVRAAVVVMAEVEPGDRRLAAYVVPDPAAPPVAADLRRYLEERLPDYMVPAAFVPVERLPLTPTGKVDRRALPAVDWGGGAAASRYVAPRTAVEEVLAGIWEQVLKVERVGIEDDFFDLGGHSLLATQVISRVRTVFGVDAPLRALFEEPSVASLAVAVEELLRGGGTAAVPPLERRGEAGGLPLSFAQQRLWFLYQLDPGSAAYNMPIAVRLDGKLDRGALAAALAEIVRRHEALRTTFQEVDGEPAQVIAGIAASAAIAGMTAPALPLADLAALGGSAGEEALRLAAADAGRPFDLARGPLFRPLLLRVAADSHLLVATMHHIVSDGWSLDIFVREVRALYLAFGAGLPSPLPELPIQYADYAVWQRRWLSGEVLERELDFWRRELAGLPPVLELPADRPRPPLQSFRGASFARELGGRPSAGVRILARSFEATPFMVLLAAFEALLGRLAGAEDFAVGVPVSGRTRQEIEGLIGFFVNSLVVRADLAGDPLFLRLLGRTRERVLATQSHQAVPFEKLVEVLQPERDLATSPLFQVMFSYNVTMPGEAAPGEAVPDVEGPAVEGPAVRPVAVERGASQFDLSLSFTEAGDRFVAGWEYASDLFDEVTVCRFADCFEVLVAAAVESSDRRLSDLPLLTPAERRQVLVEWNDTGAPPVPSTLVERWRERARLTPEAPAVVFGDQRVTFADLAGWAGRLAHRLLALGIEAEDVVAVCLERSAASVAAMLAIFQAGGAYLPLDPSYPRPRIAYLLADSGARVLITRQGLLGSLPAGLPPVLLVDGPEDGPEGDPGPDGPWPLVSPPQLAYVIYTSGSTGQPKGVGVEHGAAADHFMGMAREYELGPGDRALWFTSPGFDASLDQVLPTLFAGATVVPRGEELWGPAEMLEVCGRLGLTVVDLAPAYWQQWVREQAPDGAAAGALRLVLVAGEAMPAEEVRRWWATPMAPAGLINGYGPTEAVVTAAMFRVESGWEPRPGAAAVPLGRPLAHRAAYVLDPAGQPLPVGVPGELCLGGLLARGYLRRPELTAERFVPDPWSGAPGRRLYRTGDLVRWNREGLLEFLGRVDRQVKVRGVRIEPGEVEAALAAHPAVRQAVVEAREDGRGGRELVAWVVTAGAAGTGGGEVPEDLRDELRQRLPETLVPSRIVAVKELPVTASGKVDRRALPSPDLALPARPGGVGPRTPVEETLAAIWREVLGLEQVSVEDSFFDLGGHSLLATRVASRVRNALGVELPLRRIFEAPTIARLAAAIEQEAPAAAAEPVPAVAAGAAGVPLSFAQQRLWFLYQLDPGSPAYVMSQALLWEGEVEPGVLAAALTEIVRRHEALRTCFRELGGEVVQWVLPAAPFHLPVVDLSGLGDRAEGAAMGLAAEDATRPFDLAAGPLLRVHLLRLSAGGNLVTVAMHHIVSDGGSLELFSAEVATLYGAFRSGLPSPLPELPMQYRDYTLWQRRQLSGAVLAAELEFWRRELRGLPVRLELPADRPRPPVQSFRGRSLATSFGERLTRGLRELARGEEATLFMVLLAGFQTLLGRLAGTDDLAVGVPVSGRTRQELEGLIGFFVDSLVLRADLTGDPGFRQMVGRTRERLLDAQAHQALPFERLVEDLSPERSLGHSPLFQVMFSLDSAAGSPAKAAAAAPAARLLGFERRAALFELRVAVQETPRELGAVWEYNLDLFDRPTVLRMAGQLGSLLAGAVAAPDAPLSRLPLLDEAERAQLVSEWNDTAVHRGSGLSLPGLFLGSAARTPDTVAVSFEGASLSYGELRRRAGRLAGRLRDLGCGPEVRAAIALDRSLELIVALLGVLESGAAYVPLDPELPVERLAGMIEDAGPAVLLTRESLRFRLPAAEIPVLLLDGPEEGGEEAGEAAGLVLADDLQLAYVIFTSGSTGRPKASMLHHRGIVNRLLWMEGAYGLAAADAVLQKTPIGFDVSVWELFMPLAVGARMVLARPEGHRDAPYLADLIAGEGLTVVHFVPSMLRAYLDEPRLAACGSVRLLAASGEALAADLVARYAARFPQASLANLYGPTETSVEVSSWICGGEGDGPAVPIGRPLSNVVLHVADRQGRLAAIGVAGELWIGGVAVGRGYLGRPDLTAERFVPDPWAAGAGARAYRSGDLARHRPDGAIEFLGRVDQQVKIRGFRVEPGEIEAALAAHPAVRGAAVVARAAATGPHLVAYVVPAGELDPAVLREHLRSRLPEPMVPSLFVPLAALPVTASGKVDRRALPAPGGRAPADAPAAPRDPVEEVLAGLWMDVLGVDRVGIHDDFFELGGHSLLATRLTSRLRTVFGLEVPLRRLFETPTIAGLAGWIESATRSAGRVAPRLAPRAHGDEPAPLSFAQRRLWFLDQLDPGTTAYNMPIVQRLSGGLSPAALAAALCELVHRHEALRTVFRVDGGEPVQQVLPPVPFPLPLVDLSALPEERRSDELRRRIDDEAEMPFDLGSGPIFRGSLLRLGERDHVAAMTLHHIAGDAWSLQVLVREMAALCLAAAAGQPSPLPELLLQYADYAVWQRRWLAGEVLAGQLAYWREQLAGAPPVLELPMARPRPAVQTRRGAAEHRSLDGDLTAAIHGFARREGATPFMVLLAGLGALLGRYSGQTDIVVGSPIAGRNRQELEGLIGCFLNTLALRTGLGGDPSFLELVRRVRETTLGAYSHQDLPFEHLLEELKPERSLAHTPLFQVMINWDNSADARQEAVSLPGSLTLEALGAGEPVAKFDLELYARDLDGRLGLRMVYNRDLFDAAQVAAMLGHLEALLAAALARPEQHLSELLLERPPLPSAPSRRAAGSIPGRFAQVAAEHPDLPAVWTPEGAWTYRDLRARADGVAHALLALGGPADERVALLFTPGAPMVAAVLGTLAAGKTYVPLDPSYPRERLLVMLADSGASILLAGMEPGPELGDLAGALLVLAFDALPAPPAGWEPPPVPPEAIAYLLYTSGSTGEPKGVLQSHGNVLQHVGTYAARLGIGPGDRLTLLPSYGFDASVMDLFGGLLHGAEICPWDVKARGAEGLAAWMAEREITVYHSTPTFFRHFLEGPAETAGFPALRWVVLGGEGVGARELALFQRVFAPGCRLVNGLGPTESTLALQAVYDHQARVERPGLPVGLPVAGTEAVLWNGAGRQVAVWGTGEILLRGPYLAHGYWRRPELTAAAFVPDPEGGGERVYRTGDLGRLLPGGGLEFAGRRDSQVKIRGIRVEPAEVEVALARHPGVRENAVVAAEDRSGAPRLAAYVVAREAAGLTAAELRAFLGERLPPALVPAAFVFLPALPWTATGKLDRRALPAPELGPDGARARVPPRDEVETKLAAIWSELLGIQEIGVHDSFFDLGGHSLLITRVLARVQAVFGVVPPMRDLFADPTIAGTAAAIARERERAVPSAGMRVSAIPRRGRMVRREDLDEES